MAFTIISPRLAKAFVKLGKAVGYNKTQTPLQKIMASLTDTEEVSIIEDALKLIDSQKAALEKAIQDLTPLADENLGLREVIRGIEAANAVRDEALIRLRDKISPPAPTEPTDPPVEDPATTEPVTPPVDGEVTPPVPTQDGTEIVAGSEDPV